MNYITETTRKRIEDLAKTHALTIDGLLTILLDKYVDELHRRKVLDQIDNAPIGELRLPATIYNSLLQANIFLIKELYGIELLSIKGIGPKAVETIEAAMLMHRKLYIDAALKQKIGNR